MDFAGHLGFLHGPDMGIRLENVYISIKLSLRSTVINTIFT